LAAIARLTASFSDRFAGAAAWADAVAAMALHDNRRSARPVNRIVLFFLLQNERTITNRNERRKDVERRDRVI
jgi:hypothetical protein